MRAVLRTFWPLLPNPETVGPRWRSPVLVEALLLGAIFLALHFLYALALALTGLSLGAMLWLPNFFRFIVLGSASGVDFVVNSFLFLAAWVAAFVVGRKRWDLTYRACFGAWILAYFVLRAIYGFLPDLGAVFTAGSQPAAIPRAVLYRQLIAKSFREVVLPLWGVVLIFGGMPRLRAVARRSRARIGDILADIGVRVRRSALVDSMHGLWLFVALLFGSLALEFFITAVAPVLQTADRSAVFSESSVDLGIMLSLVAGVGEEFLFRGILLSLLLAAFRVPYRTTPSRWVAMGAAVALQALLFAFVHSSYQDFALLLFAFSFGVIAGLTFIRFGLVPAIIMHVLIDVFAFLDPFRQSTPAVEVFLGMTLATAIVLPLLYFGFRLLVWRQTTTRQAERRLRS